MGQGASGLTRPLPRTVLTMVSSAQPAHKARCISSRLSYIPHDLPPNQRGDNAEISTALPPVFPRR